MRNLPISFLIVLLISQGATAQGIDWAVRLGSVFVNPGFPDEEDKITAVVPDNEGNVYVAGNIYPGGSNINGVPLTCNGYSDIFLAKFDCQANLLWYKTAGGIFDDNVTGLELDDMGNLYLAGTLDAGNFNKWMFFDTLIGDSNITSWYIAKFDTSGNYLWGKMASQHNSFSFAENFILNKDGLPCVFLYAGQYELMPGVSTPNNGSFILTLDTAGAFVSLIEPNAPYDSLRPTDFIQDAVGNYYLTGVWRVNTININGTIYQFNTRQQAQDSNYYTYSCDSLGNFRWFEYFEDTVSTFRGGEGYAISVDSDNNIYVLGACAVNLSSNGFLFVQRPNYASDPQFLIKYGNTGNQLWVKQFDVKNFRRYSGALSKWKNGHAVGSFSFGGGSVILDNDTISHPITNAGHLVFFNFDENGTLSNIDKLVGVGYDRILSVNQDDYGNTYLGGTFQSTIFIDSTQVLASTGGQSDGFIARFGNVCTVGLADLDSPARQNQLTIYPNPAESNIHLKGSSDFLISKITVFDLNGKIVETLQVNTSTEVTLDISRLYPGMYILISESKSGNRMQGRFVKF
jgi:hypothetical protein